MFVTAVDKILHLWRGFHTLSLLLHLGSHLALLFLMLDFSPFANPQVGSSNLKVYPVFCLAGSQILMLYSHVDKIVIKFFTVTSIFKDYF